MFCQYSYRIVVRSKCLVSRENEKRKNLGDPKQKIQRNHISTIPTPNSFVSDHKVKSALFDMVIGYIAINLQLGDSISRKREIQKFYSSK